MHSVLRCFGFKNLHTVKSLFVLLQLRALPSFLSVIFTSCIFMSCNFLSFNFIYCNFMPCNFDGPSFSCPSFSVKSQPNLTSFCSIVFVGNLIYKFAYLLAYLFSLLLLCAMAYGQTLYKRPRSACFGHG